MAIDLTKLVLETSYDAFKNNEAYTGTLTISGTANVGLNTRTTSRVLSSPPDMTDIVFNGPAAFGGISDPRPANGWFKQGYVYVRGDNGGAGYTNYPTAWNLSAEIVGSTINITAWCRVEFLASLTLTSTNVSWRLVDYSVF